MVAHVILFRQENFDGVSRNVFVEEADLGREDGDPVQDAVASFVIFEGRWTFWRDSNFSGERSITLGPGRYRRVEDLGIPKDAVASLSSIRC